MAKYHVCNRDFKVLLVGGFKASKTEVHEAAWKLCTWIFDYSERQRRSYYDKVQSVVNSAGNLMDIPETDVNQIMKFIVDAGHCADGITRAVFAHSHGAKLVYSALKASTVCKFLAENYNYSQEEAEKRVKDLRHNLAVFTMGGINKIPNNFAKIVVNLRFQEDAKSFIGEKLYGETTDQDETTKVLVLKEDSKKSSIVTWFQNIFVPVLPESGATRTEHIPEPNTRKRKFADEEELAERESLWINFTSAVSAGKMKHVLNDYMLSEEMMEKIITCLSLDEDLDCACVTDKCTCPIVNPVYKSKSRVAT